MQRRPAYQHGRLVGEHRPPSLATRSPLGPSAPRRNREVANWGRPCRRSLQRLTRSGCSCQGARPSRTSTPDILEVRRCPYRQQMVRAPPLALDWPAEPHPCRAHAAVTMAAAAQPAGFDLPGSFAEGWCEGTPLLRQHAAMHHLPLLSHPPLPPDRAVHRHRFRLPHHGLGCSEPQARSPAASLPHLCVLL